MFPSVFLFCITSENLRNRNLAEYICRNKSRDYENQNGHSQHNPDSVKRHICGKIVINGFLSETVCKPPEECSQKQCTQEYQACLYYKHSVYRAGFGSIAFVNTDGFGSSAERRYAQQHIVQRCDNKNCYSKNREGECHMPYLIRTGISVANGGCHSFDTYRFGRRVVTEQNSSNLFVEIIRRFWNLFQSYILIPAVSSIP